MVKTNALFLVILSTTWAGNLINGSLARGADDNLRVELDQAKEEIQQLRAELKEFKESSNWKSQQQELRQLLDKAPAASNDSPAGSLVLPTGWSIQPYGYFKFDMSYDDSAVNGENGDYITSVKPENATTRADDKLSFTARQTRLGLKVFAPNIGDLKVMGRVEIDFYNPVTSSTNEYKSTPQMRHAYGEVAGADWSILFGQTSDLISPLLPDVLNYTVGWFGGNMGYRHPQLKFSKWWDCPETENRFKIETALSREINQDLDGGGVDDGQDSSYPTVLGRVSYALPCHGKHIEAGLSGHLGREEIDWSGAGDDDEVHTWSVNTDLVVPVCEKVEVKGEMFFGENLDSYFGGIGQGVNSTTHDPIESRGGWVQLGYKPLAEWAFNTGAGIDHPNESDLNDNDKSSNCFIFSNANYYFSKYLSTGIELSYWRTGYKNSDAGDDFRVQHSWQLSF